MDQILMGALEQPQLATSLAVVDATTCSNQGSWWNHPATAESASSLGQLSQGPRASLGRPLQADSCSALFPQARAQGHFLWTACHVSHQGTFDPELNEIRIKQSFWMGQRTMFMGHALRLGQRGLMPLMLRPMPNTYLPAWRPVNMPTAIPPSIRCEA